VSNSGIAALAQAVRPADIDEAVLPRWEAASRALDVRMPKAIEMTGPLIAAVRDTAALCAVLPAARVLGRSIAGQAPLICRHLQQWGLACERLPAENVLVAIERAGFLQLLVEAGLAPLIWDGLQLAIVHLCVPHVGRLDAGPVLVTDYEPALLPEEEELTPPGEPLEGASCYWYEVTGPKS
jgi:hypothetical protein